MSTAPQAGPSGIGQMRRTKNRWTTTKLEHLVRVWSYYYKDLQLKRDHPVPIYRRIVDEMVRKGYSASLEDVRGRIHNLAAKFRKEAVLSQASGRPSNWPLFYQIQEFMNYEVPQMEAEPKLRATTYIINSGEILSTEPQYLEEERLEENGESQKETLSDDKAMEVEHLEDDGLEEERLEEERLEEERLEEERLEEERLEEERLEEERLEEERLEEERLEEEPLEEEHLEAERLEAGRLQEERLEAERLEAERLEERPLEEECLEEDRIKENEESDQSQDKDIVQNQPSLPQRPLLKELQEEIQQKQNKLQQQAKARQQQKLPQRQLVPAQQHPRQTNQQQQPKLTQQQQPHKMVRQPIPSTTQRHPPQHRQEQKQQNRQQQQQQQLQEQRQQNRQEQQQHQPHRQEQKERHQTLRQDQKQQHRQEQQKLPQRQEQKQQNRPEQQQHQRQEQKQQNRQEQQKQQQRREQKQQHRLEQQQHQPHRQEQKQQHLQEQQQHQRQAQKQKRWQELKQQQQLHEQQQRSQQQWQRKLRRIQHKQQKMTTDDDTCGEETPSPPPTPPPPPLRTLKHKASESRTTSKDRSREPRQRLLQIKSNHRLETIDDYYAKLYCNNMLADVTLVVWHEGETITLPAHRVILCNHSPYFAAIFEKVSAIVGLGAVLMILPTDIPLKVMELLLQFIYSGEASIPANMIDDVWRCAVQLKIRGFWSESRGESNEPLVSQPEQQLNAGLPSAVHEKVQSDRRRNGGTKRGRSRSEEIEENSRQARKRARRHEPSPSPSSSPSPSPSPSLSDVDEFDKIELIEVSSELGFDLLRSDLDEDGDDADGEYADDNEEEEMDEDEEEEEDEGEDENHETNEEDEEQATGEEDEARSIDEFDDDVDGEEEEEEEDSEESDEEDSDGDDGDEYEILGVDDNGVEEDEVGQAVKSERPCDEAEQEPKEGTAERNIAVEQPPDTLESVQESVDNPTVSCVKPEADLTPPPSFPNSPQEVGCETKLEINGGVIKVESNGYASNGVVGDVGCQSNSAASRLPPVVGTSVQPSSRVRIDSSMNQTSQQRVAVTTPFATRGPVAVYRKRQYRSFTCKLCPMNFTMADNWLKHVEKTHARDTRNLNRFALQVQDKPTKSYCCDLCQKCLTSEFDWVQHVICQHTELYPHYFAESFGVTPPE